MTDLLVLLLLAVLCVVAAIGILVKPKVFVTIGLLVVCFEDSLVHLTGLERFTYFDEVFVIVAMVLLPVRRLLSRQRLRVTAWFGWTALLLAAGLVSSLIHQVPVHVMLLGAFSLFKWILLAFAIAQVDWETADFKRAVPLLSVFVFVIIGSGILNLLFPGWWTSTFFPGGVIEQRFGMTPLIGPFTHPSSFATVAAFISIAIAAYRTFVRKSALTAFLLLTSALQSVLAFRRRLWLSLIFGLGSVWASRSSRVSLFIVVLAVVPLAAFFTGNFFGGVAQKLVLDYLSDDASLTTARTVMTLDSLRIAAGNFPLGVGFGRFGSYPAALYYSPEYVSRGYQNIWGLTPVGGSNSEFLMDTYWPILFGETGWLGAVAFAVALALIWRNFVSLQGIADAPMAQWVGATGVGWLIFSVLDSVASPAFTNIHGSMLFALIGVSIALKDGLRLKDASAGDSKLLKAR